MPSRQNAAPRDARKFDRDETHYRSRALCARRTPVRPLIVNISPRGFMARTDFEPAVGDVMTVTLPIVGPVEAVVRWTLGGRLGCEFEPMLPIATYADILMAMRAQP